MAILLLVKNSKKRRCRFCASCNRRSTYSSSSSLLKTAGTYHVTCDLHSWMSAWVVVTDQPYVAVTGTDGTFSIDDVPPGEYKVRIWHEEMGEVIRDVVVKAGESSTVDLRIGG